jgi:hypothetical protein
VQSARDKPKQHTNASGKLHATAQRARVAHAPTITTTNPSCPTLLPAPRGMTEHAPLQLSEGMDDNSTRFLQLLLQGEQPVRSTQPHRVVWRVSATGAQTCVYYTRVARTGPWKNTQMPLTTRTQTQETGPAHAGNSCVRCSPCCCCAFAPFLHSNITPCQHQSCLESIAATLRRAVLCCAVSCLYRASLPRCAVPRPDRQELRCAVLCCVLFSMNRACKG